jgi:hypothetical protein
VLFLIDDGRFTINELAVQKIWNLKSKIEWAEIIPIEPGTGNAV